MQCLSKIFLFLYQSLYILAEDTDALEVFATLRNDDVSIALGRFDKLLVHRLQDLEVSVYHHRYGATLSMVSR